EWVGLQHQEGNRVPRWHRPKGGGLGLTTVLIQAVKAHGVADILTSAEVKKILTQNGKVCGLNAINTKSGDPVEIQSKNVVVATGGFNSNLNMIREVRPDLKDFKIMEGAGRGATGAGHQMARELGAYLTHMGDIWFYIFATPDYLDPSGKRGLVFRGTPGYIWVNQQGRRFHDESRSGGATGSPAVMAQDPPHAWAIIDTVMADTLNIADPHYRQGDKDIKENLQALLDNSPYVRKADSLAELGRKMEVDLTNFQPAVEKYNHACESGLEREPEFGKQLKNSKKFDTPPYYAIQMFPLARKNFGGIKTDLRCHALDKHFDVIPGLIAAGEVSGMAGGHINGRAGLEGTMLGPSIFSGRVAGATAAQEAGFGPGFVGTPHRP
ncbi:MAG: FAD-binding protein, partial [Deltaproteobacteria bacterium]|nr:FAD-binding protein [Deltaproteobacteria bacterium]